MLKNAILFWPRFFTEVYYTIKYYNAVNSIKEELISQGLRIDWIGRIYTVVNIKEEFAQQPEMIQQSIVFQQLKPINDILLKYGLSDLSFPEISKIPGTYQFLVVLFPENDYFNWPAFLRNIIFLGLLVGTILGVLSFFDTSI